MLSIFLVSVVCDPPGTIVVLEISGQAATLGSVSFFSSDNCL